MSGDIRTRLSEALDQAERLAKAAAKSAPAPWTADVFGGDGSAGMLQDSRGEDLWDCEGAASLAMAAPVALHAARWDPSTVLRLIERDRAMAESHWPQPLIDPDNEERPDWPERACRICSSQWMGTPEWARGEDFVPPEPDYCDFLKALAAGWLGTPEVDR